jgi:DNA-binding NarL/FixJ family response regulator
MRKAPTAADGQRRSALIKSRPTQGRFGSASQLAALAVAIVRVYWHCASHPFATDLVRHSHKEARRSFEPLKPAQEQSIDLIAELEHSARQMIEGGFIELTVETLGDPVEIAVGTAVELLRIGQEAIANAVPHAIASRLEIRLQFAPSSATLTVEDDGVGFVKRGDLLGFGLRGIRKRAASIAARLEIDSAPEMGHASVLPLPCPRRRLHVIRQDFSGTTFGASSLMPTRTSSTIRILIADDHPVVCSGLTSMLSSHSEIEVVGSASSGEEAIASLAETHPHVLLLDLRMPGMDGLTVLRALGRMEAPPRVIVLTSFEKEEDIYRAIRAGAQGYLLKDSTEAEMISALQTVHSGKRYIPRHIAARLADRMLRSDLTARELQILNSLSLGHTNKEIAKNLRISENTVRHHVTSIMEKLQVSDRTEAVAMALRTGVLSEMEPSAS